MWTVSITAEDKQKKSVSALLTLLMSSVHRIKCGQFLLLLKISRKICISLTDPSHELCTHDKMWTVSITAEDKQKKSVSALLTLLMSSVHRIKCGQFLLLLKINRKNLYQPY